MGAGAAIQIPAVDAEAALGRLPVGAPPQERAHLVNRHAQSERPDAFPGPDGFLGGGRRRRSRLLRPDDPGIRAPVLAGVVEVKRVADLVEGEGLEVVARPAGRLGSRW